jgi:hypothetical protein
MKPSAPFTVYVDLPSRLMYEPIYATLSPRRVSRWLISRFSQAADDAMRDAAAATPAASRASQRQRRQLSRLSTPFSLPLATPNTR